MGGKQSHEKTSNENEESNFREQGNQVEINDAKKEYVSNTIAIFVTIKIRVKRIPELEKNFKGFRAYWEEEIQKAVENCGEIKVINVIT